ncbi:hypothetical protein GUITHDRAFT_145734 [Guillardia theta CCMP2712]|uniref:Uncharacterized protein n=1 Tax=Guillardia theta (strain CCMP2712) TaxID=905079 RepID=L1IKK9_GUITC|nr:hypothetical protein GUITHDRAFT_145734 [Guillardia theta CCMP2712]EKX36464.1 hypothetical protein GUITHDRAFT_145734 [Guillardia theta CCMP2712]|mmetsp:Transcript_38708/g.121919  ORF Transcript_38708/g.121919 Transcript_38708/m.121919 type:complete len:211 (-) Transcript_38708:316-948(-)|eukprot:XP_005823444.1 hypothetical protein GUITHDRAFT_145734 [Guillardia theta CCMP2712]
MPSTAPPFLFVARLILPLIGYGGQVGKPKPSTMNLPPPEHVYGYKMMLDAAGAGNIIGGWMEHTPNEATQPGRDFKKLNRMAIIKGSGLTPSQVADFRRTHDARLRGGSMQHQQAIVLPSSRDPEFAYGVKNVYGTEMGALISNQYMRDFIQSQQRKETQSRMASKKIPVMHTKASLGHRYVEVMPDDRTPFKMKRFLNVEGKLSRDQSR